MKCILIAESELDGLFNDAAKSLDLHKYETLDFEVNGDLGQHAAVIAAHRKWVHVFRKLQDAVKKGRAM